MATMNSKVEVSFSRESRHLLERVVKALEHRNALAIEQMDTTPPKMQETDPSPT